LYGHWLDIISNTRNSTSPLLSAFENIFNVLQGWPLKSGLHHRQSLSCCFFLCEMRHGLHSTPRFLVRCGMNPTGSYKGIRVNATPKQLEDGGWTADFVLARENDSETVETPYYGQRSYETRELAIQEAFEMARREIDRLP